MKWLSNNSEAFKLVFPDFKDINTFKLEKADKKAKFKASKTALTDEERTA